MKTITQWKASDTPGPWFPPSRQNPSEVTAFRSFQDGAQHPVVIAVVTKHGTDEERQANARLIAAAPELLAALEACNAFLTAEFNDSHIHQQARAAIAKAKGQP